MGQMVAQPKYTSRYQGDLENSLYELNLNHWCKWIILLLGIKWNDWKMEGNQLYIELLSWIQRRLRGGRGILRELTKLLKGWQRSYKNCSPQV